MAVTSSSKPGGVSAKNARSFPVIPRREIEALIAEGRAIIIVAQHVLKVDAWMKFHPGGDKAIRHMIGRDATDEVNWFVILAASHRARAYRGMKTADCR